MLTAAYAGGAVTLNGADDVLLALGSMITAPGIVTINGDVNDADPGTGSGADALDFPASLVFKGRQLFISNLSLNDGGIHSKISVLDVPLPGLPLRP